MMYKMVDGPIFKLSYWASADPWRASIHLHYRWFGAYYWHLWFLPW